MKYVVECRKKQEDGEISVFRFAGFGDGLPNKKIADTVYSREIQSNKWDAVYMEKVFANGTAIDEKSWYKAVTA